MTAPGDLLAARQGCYEAARASALSGVPLSTVYHWARTGLVIPSISPSREMLWSYADLMTLRLVAWLRRSKPRLDDRPHYRASPMHQVRSALAEMADRGIDPWSGAGTPSLLVDADGNVLIQDGAAFVDMSGQPTFDLPEDSLDLLRPFALEQQPGGPDLVRPRPTLRIVPTKVAGEPHVDGTRITSRALSTLATRGVPQDTVRAWYDLPDGAFDDAVDLERQLSGPRRVA